MRKSLQAFIQPHWAVPLDSLEHVPDQKKGKYLLVGELHNGDIG
jgi:hypothetical protein